MLYIEPTGGLCNRMRALNSAIFLADKAGVQLSLVWLITWDMGAPVTHLFELPSFISIIESNQTSIVQELEKKAGKVMDQEELANLFYNHYPMEELFEFFPSIYMRTGGIVYKNQHFHYFKPIDQLQKIINQYISNFDQNVIGIHIRRTDNENAIKYSTTEAFIIAMELEIIKNPQVKFYLATDSPEIENLFIKRYQNRVIFHSKEFRRDTEKSIQDAVIDLYCLASTQKILASYWSSFSDIAAEINHIEKKVIYQES